MLCGDLNGKEIKKIGDICIHMGFLVAQVVMQVAPALQETPVRFLSQEDPLEKGQATHSSILGLPWWLRQ